MRIVGWIATNVFGLAILMGLIRGLAGPPPSVPAFIMLPPTPRGEIVSLAFRRGGLDTVVMVILEKITIKNLGTVDLKDIRVACDMTGLSGTTIGRPSSTIYDTVQPGQTRTFQKVNLGFVRSQVTNGACHLVRS